MSQTKFKTMRHIETVRNYLNLAVKELLKRAEEHDQSKLDPPESDIFEIYTPKLRECTYGSDEYKGYLNEMQVALDHHYKTNRHHPEYFKAYPEQGLSPVHSMNIFDLLEMLLDWNAATKRHNDGNIMKSIDINEKRFKFGPELKRVFLNTVMWIWEQEEKTPIYHKANES